MANLNTTTQGSTATLTERELFAEYVSGKVCYKANRRKYTANVEDLFAGSGETGHFMDAMPAALEYVLEEDDPTYELKILKETLQGMVADVDIATEGFENLKVMRLVEGENGAQVYSAGPSAVMEAA